MNARIEELTQYIAKVNPRGVIKLANKHGYKHPASEEGRKGMLLQFLSDSGADGLRDLAYIHPDTELIMSSYEEVGATSFDGAKTEYLGEQTGKNSSFNLISLGILFILVVSAINGKL